MKTRLTICLAQVTKIIGRYTKLQGLDMLPGSLFLQGVFGESGQLCLIGECTVRTVMSDELTAIFECGEIEKLIREDLDSKGYTFRQEFLLLPKETSAEFYSDFEIIVLDVKPKPPIRTPEESLLPPNLLCSLTPAAQAVQPAVF